MSDNMNLLTPLSAQITKSTAKKGMHEYNRIPSFEGFAFQRWDLVVTGSNSHKISFLSKEEYTISFSSTKDTPKEALRELFAAVAISLKIDRDENYSSEHVVQSKLDKDYSAPKLHEIAMSSVARFMKEMGTEGDSFPFHKFPLIEDYRYLHYSNCKWASEMLSYNLQGVVFAETLGELEQTLMELVPEDAPAVTISSVLDDEVQDIPSSNPLSVK